MSISSLIVCVVLSAKSSINFIWTNNMIISKSQERIGLVDKPAQHCLLSIRHEAGAVRSTNI